METSEPQVSAWETSYGVSGGRDIGQKSTTEPLYAFSAFRYGDPSSSQGSHLVVVVKMANLAGTLLGRCISDGRREDGQAQSVHVRCSRRRRGRRSGDKWAPARDVTGETNVFGPNEIG